jgi:hypothetical protein
MGQSRNSVGQGAGEAEDQDLLGQPPSCQSGGRDPATLYIDVDACPAKDVAVRVADAAADLIGCASDVGAR